MKNCLRILGILTIALSAMCMAHAAQPGQDQSGAAMQTDATRKVVFHIDADQPERLLMALENTRNLFKEIPPDKCSVHVVTNGKAVILFRKDRAASYAADMEALHKQGVHFKACRNAMAKNKVEKSDLLDICEVVPAGILELINLQQQGFAYIKP